MAKDIERRRFIALAASSVAWPVRASAQHPALPVIGIVGPSTPAERIHLMAAVRQGLAEMGFVEGRHVAIEYFEVEGQYDRLPALAADLVRRNVSVIATLSVTPAAVAVKAATTTIPIVFLTAADPVRIGLVTSLSHPGDNITGIAYVAGEISAERLEVLHEVVPNARVVAILVNPNSPATQIQVREIQAAARIIRLELIVVGASTEGEIEAAFTAIIREGARAVLVASDPFLFARRDQLVALAARHKIPAMYTQREYAAAGGLMSYAPDIAAGYRRAGIYIGRILKGAKPADLPVLQVPKRELTINLKTAGALAIEIPHSLLATADEVIE